MDRWYSTTPAWWFGTEAALGSGGPQDLSLALSSLLCESNGSGNTPTVSASSPGLASNHGGGQGEAWLASTQPSAVQSVDDGLPFPGLCIISPKSQIWYICGTSGLIQLTVNCTYSLVHVLFCVSISVCILNCHVDCIVKFGKAKPLILFAFMVN